MLCLSCGPDSQEAKAGGEERSASPESVSGAGEDDLLVRLSADLVADPSTQAERDRNAIIDYAIENMLDVQATPSGLYYQVLDPGEGEPIGWGDRIRANYRGYFLDGQEFDSSYRRGRPMEFYVGNTIGGWNEGLQLIAPGGNIFLIVPSDLAYGEEGISTSEGKVLVPPNKVLAFEVGVEEVLERADQ